MGRHVWIIGPILPVVLFNVTRMGHKNMNNQGMSVEVVEEKCLRCSTTSINQYNFIIHLCRLIIQY